MRRLWRWLFAPRPDLLRIVGLPPRAGTTHTHVHVTHRESDDRRR